MLIDKDNVVRKHPRQRFELHGVGGVYILKKVAEELYEDLLDAAGEMSEQEQDHLYKLLEKIEKHEKRNKEKRRSHREID